MCACGGVTWSIGMEHSLGQGFARPLHHARIQTGPFVIFADRGAFGLAPHLTCMLCAFGDDLLAFHDIVPEPQHLIPTSLASSLERSLGIRRFTAPDRKNPLLQALPTAWIVSSMQMHHLMTHLTRQTNRRPTHPRESSPRHERAPRRQTDRHPRLSTDPTSSA